MKSKFFTIATLVIAVAGAAASVGASAANLDNFLFDQMATPGTATRTTRADASFKPAAVQPAARNVVSQQANTSVSGSSFYGVTGQMQVDAPALQAPRQPVFAGVFSRDAALNK